MILFERMQRYENTYNNVLLSRAPIIVRCSIRNYNRVIKKLPKPYSAEFWKILRETMFSTVKDVEGAVFSFQQNGEISFILRQIDDDGVGPYGGQIQKIGSVISSLITSNFMKHYLASDDPPDIIGEAIFESIVFNTPSISEAFNYLIGQQYQCSKYALSVVAEEELSKVIDNIDFLNRKSLDQKKELLKTECEIIFDDNYNNYFKLGSCSFKTPKIKNDIAKKKWTLLETSPDFISEKNIILNIIKTGQDIFRPERDIQNV